MRLNSPYIYIYILFCLVENEIFTTTSVQHRQHGEAVGCATFFSGLISRYVFDILQIPSWCSQICSGWIALLWQRDCTSSWVDVDPILKV